uniref:DUF4283 domain-containing protein n=1 Tax=Kalanchoe fedtschenkoi TaxID=63787 RepID=A0A7N0R9U4_KALFE
MSHEVILKFAEGRSKVEVVREHIRKNWSLVEVLTRDSQRMEGKGFHTFRWMPGFSTKRESTSMVTWVRLHGLDPCLYRPSFLREVCRGFGVFHKADSATLDMSNPTMAHVCVEIDLRCSLVPGVWVGTEQHQQWVDIEYEGNIEYCYCCKKQGYSVDICKKELAKSKRLNLKERTVDHREGSAERSSGNSIRSYIYSSLPKE